MFKLCALGLAFSVAFVDSAQSEIIHLHAKRGNLEGVLAELGKGVPLDIRSKNMTTALGVTPLFVASKFGQIEVVKALLARGADPTIFFDQADGIYTVGTALHHAAGYGHIEVVKALIEAGADPASYEAYIATPVHQALRAGHFDVANLLLAAGAQAKVEFPSVLGEMEKADIERGREFARGCVVCHGEPSATQLAGEGGPSLWGIFGQPAASDPNFEYSDFLRESDLIWDADNLNSYLASPYQFVPGTRKVMLGIEKSSDRANLIAYLATLSD